MLIPLPLRLHNFVNLGQLSGYNSREHWRSSMPTMLDVPRVLGVHLCISGLLTCFQAVA
jgi:hypothetical protein